MQNHWLTNIVPCLNYCDEYCCSQYLYLRGVNYHIVRIHVIHNYSWPMCLCYHVEVKNMGYVQR
jgi:hypothetical protein